MNTHPTAAPRMQPMGWLLSLMAAILLVVGLARWQGWHEALPTDGVAWEMSLQFEDMPNGDVRVTRSLGHEQIALFSGEQGFLRGTLRAIARQRRVTQNDPTAPLILRGLQDGRLQLVDPLQNLHIDLDSFGSTNKAVFADLHRNSTSVH
jgi:putative photosynthetic complex assembly protein